MKEIDFLPKWYKTGRRRRLNYRRQYIIIAGVFITLVAWSFSANYSISSIEAQVNHMQSSLKNNERIASLYNDLQDSLNDMQKYADILDKVDSGIRVSPLLAELSYLVGGNITLVKLDVKAEEYQPEKKSGSSSVKFAGSRSKKEQDSMPLPNTRFRVVINGISKDAADVTAFIARLEESEYFRQIIVGYLQDIRDSSDSKFEVSCFIGNYTLEGKKFPAG